MYPRGQLEQLATRKMLVQARIAVRRHECAAAAAGLAQPLALVDRGIELWRRIAPIVKVVGAPVLFMTARKLIKHRVHGKLSGLLGALPIMMRAFHMLMHARSGKPDHSASRSGTGPAPAAAARGP